MIIINTALSPVQQRNLKWPLDQVIDRTQLIWKFLVRARNYVGRLQALVALSFQRSRLVRSWIHLGQRGGGGFLAAWRRQIELIGGC